jgi:hypothetical protein
LIKKIFIGNQNISSQISDWKYGFNQNGVGTLTAVSNFNSVIVNRDVDYNLSEMKRYWFGGVRPRTLQKKLQDHFSPNRRLFRKAVRECDTFMFICTTFQNDFSDYEILKRKGKKIITLFIGDDVRWYEAMRQHFSAEGIPPIKYPEYDHSLTNLISKLRFLRTAEKYSDLIISVPDQSQLALKPYKYFSTIINTQSIKENTAQSQVPLVIHAPSDRIIKGTEHILDAVNKLKSEGLQFEFKLIENMPHTDVLGWYEKCDVVIGQLGIGLGKQGMEVLATGKVLLTGLHPMSAPNKNYTNDNPSVNISKENIAEKLREVILNYDERCHLAKRGRAFIEKYHSPVTMCREILQLLQTSEERRTYDIHPLFFREQFIPESEESLEVYNQWTEFVKQESWYKKYVKPGERKGLRF